MDKSVSRFPFPVYPLSSRRKKKRDLYFHLKHNVWNIPEGAKKPWHFLYTVNIFFQPRDVIAYVLGKFNPVYLDFYTDVVVVYDKRFTLEFLFSYQEDKES
jgi:hypothetical protein